MDEELNENELEERLYAMLHHVDETQANVKATGEIDAVKIIENAPRSTIRRYWRTSGEYTTPPSHYQKVNTSKETPTNRTVTTDIPKAKENVNNKTVTTNIPKPRETPVNKAVTTNVPKPKETPVNKAVTTNIPKPKDTTGNKTGQTDNPQPKEEKNASPPPTDLSLFQTPPRIINKTIEILDIDTPKPVVLESSDEDEVIEVALPPKPTITIESSDEDDVCIITKPTPSKNQDSANKPNGDRDSASPVPSVVSSVSDDFIRGDCIALNISSRRADNHTFDFSLHGSDLLDQTTPVKKKKKKKAKELTTSTPVAAADTNNTDACFATPKSKAKHKKQKSKSTVVPEKAVPSVDVYDSDSNNAKQNSYTVTDKSLPSADVYDSDSNQSEIVKVNVPSETNVTKNTESSDSNISIEGTLGSTPKTTKSSNNVVIDDSIVDLTESDYITLDQTSISENIVMANVTGFTESMDYGDDSITSVPDPTKLGSTKIPPMLYDNLDFDNLKGKDKVCKRRRYSLTTLRAEMEKFYNESWGGEEFNHREIQKYMSRDKSLWVIDPKDRMPGLSKRRTTCHYCDRPGHRDDMCRMKPPVCYMCGSTGHYEPRCPAKICVNCGSPNQMYSSMCRNCSSWHRITCGECGQLGHPATHCPDLWRRYHNTVDIHMPLEESRQYKKHSQLYCSGCTRRGHLVHSCRLTLPFSGLPINSPYVSVYRPIYRPVMDSENSNNTTNQEERHNQQNSMNQSQDSSYASQKSRDSRNKRQSKSPNAFENQREFKKKKYNSMSETSETIQNSDNVGKNGNSRKFSTSSKGADDTCDSNIESEKALDFIPISSNNHDKKGQMIQDNEVSDTSDVITMARIYVTHDVLENFKTEDGQAWLKKTMEKCNVLVQNSEVSSFLTIKGKVADQEGFQAELRDWMSTSCHSHHNTTSEVESGEHVANTNDSVLLNHIPKKRRMVLKVIGQALDSLKQNLGEPDALYKRLTYLQKQHKNLLKQKVISPGKLSNSTDSIKQVLRKLNMILLGQAGLANGQQSLKKLHALQQRLIQLTQKTLSAELRKEIAQHYQSIFVAIERNDYSELLQKYHGRNETTIQAATPRKRHRKFKKVQRKAENDGSKNSINPTPQKLMKENFPVADLGEAKTAPDRTLAKLVSYRQKLEKAHPKNRNQKMQRVTLVRKLHTFINSLFRKEQINSKTAKKMKRIQSEAHQFLITNV